MELPGEIFQTSFLANQPIRFRPLKFRGVQIILYQLDQTLLPPGFFVLGVGKRVLD